MAMVMALLRELPDPADAEVRSVVMSLGPRATPAAMRGVVTKLSAPTRETTRAMLITQVQEAILAARAACAGSISIRVGPAPKVHTADRPSLG